MNNDLKATIKRNGLVYKDLAIFMGVSRDRVSHILCKPLSKPDRERIKTAIKLAKEQKDLAKYEQKERQEIHS